MTMGVCHCEPRVAAKQSAIFMDRHDRKRSRDDKRRSLCFARDDKKGVASYGHL